MNSELETLKTEYAALKAERDEWIAKYRAIELANKDMSRVDHLTVGELIMQNSELRAKLSQCDDDHEKTQDKLSKCEADSKSHIEAWKERVDLCITLKEELTAMTARAEASEHYKKRWIDTKSERDNLRVQYESTREKLKLAEVGLQQIAGEHDSFICDDQTDCEWVARDTLEKLK